MLSLVRTIALIIAFLSFRGLAPEPSGIKYSNIRTPVTAAGNVSGNVKNSGNAGRSLSYLALGDSYTIGQSVAVADRYPVQVIKLLNTGHLHCPDPEIIAGTGWTTANLEDALQSYIQQWHSINPTISATALPSYDIVTLLIGVNDQYQGHLLSDYRDRFTLLLQRAIGLAGNKASHVIVMSIPDYSVTPFGRKNASRIAVQIDSFNAVNYRISADLGVHYLDITPESRKAAADASLIASDSLHFSGKEYGIWAAMLEPVMIQALDR